MRPQHIYTLICRLRSTGTWGRKGERERGERVPGQFFHHNTRCFHHSRARDDNAAQLLGKNLKSHARVGIYRITQQANISMHFAILHQTSVVFSSSRRVPGINRKESEAQTFVTRWLLEANIGCSTYILRGLLKIKRIHSSNNNAAPRFCTAYTRGSIQLQCPLNTMSGTSDCCMSPTYSSVVRARCWPGPWRPPAHSLRAGQSQRSPRWKPIAPRQ